MHADKIARLPHRVGSAVALLVLFAGSLFLFERLWHRHAVSSVLDQPGGWLGAVAIAVSSAIVHEMLHAAGWLVAADLNWRSLSIRPTWRKFGIAVQVNVPISARAYRIGLALPILTLGLLPLATGLAFGRGLVVCWALFFLLECFADLTLLLATANVPANVQVTHHPT